MNTPLSRSCGSRAVVYVANGRVRWPVQPLSQRPGPLANACAAPAPHAPHSPRLCHTAFRVLATNLAAARDPDRAFRAGPTRVRWGLPRRAYPTVWPPGCSSEVSPREAGTGAEPLSTGGAAHCEAGSGQGHQGRARGHACEHPPPSMLTAPAGDNRPLRAAAQEHKRAAGPRSARPYHTPCTHRATATRLLHRPTGSKSALTPP